MKLIKIKFICLILVSLTIQTCFAIEKTLNSNETAPNIVLFDLNNKLFNLRKLEYDGFILISFSATYCKPCKEEIKEFMNLQKIYESKLKIFLIFIDSNIDKVKSYVQDNKINLPILCDPNQIAYKKYSVTAIPTSFLLDKNKIIIYKSIGYNKKFIQKIEELIK